MWILLYLLLIVLVSVVIYLGTLVVVNRDVVFYNKTPLNKVKTEIKPNHTTNLNVISRAEKLVGVRQRTVPNFIDQSTFTYKPSFESKVTKLIYDFLRDTKEKWVLYTCDNDKLSGYIYPRLECLSPEKKLSEYNLKGEPMNVILVFKEYMSYVEPIEYLKSIEGSKYYMPIMGEKHDYVFRSGDDEIDVDSDIDDVFVNVDELKQLDLDMIDFRRAYIKIGSLKDFLKIREFCDDEKYEIHYDSSSVVHVEKKNQVKIKEV